MKLVGGGSEVVEWGRGCSDEEKHGVKIRYFGTYFWISRTY